MLDKSRAITVRTSTEDDVPAMLAIYAHHIQRGLGEFDVEPLHGDDIKRRRKNMLKRRLPHLVAEIKRAVHASVIQTDHKLVFGERFPDNGKTW